MYLGRRLSPFDHRDVVVELNRSFALDHDHRGSTHLGEPITEETGVADGRGQRDEAHRRRRQDQDLLPDPTAKRILQVVHLVENYQAQRRELIGLGQEHVAQDLGRHDHYRRCSIYRRITRQQTHARGTEEFAQLVVLLIRQRLQGRGVERALFALELAADGVVGDQGLPRARRRTHEHVHALVDGLDGVELESVKAKAQPVDEPASVLEDAHLCSNLPTPMEPK